MARRVAAWASGSLFAGLGAVYDTGRERYEVPPVLLTDVTLPRAFFVPDGATAPAAVWKWCGADGPRAA